MPESATIMTDSNLSYAMKLSELSHGLQLKHVNLRGGDQLKIKGLVLHDAEVRKSSTALFHVIVFYVSTENRRIFIVITDSTLCPKSS